MDILKFAPSATAFESGQVVNNIKRKTWIERYRDAGEFTFGAGVDSGVREALPLGTCVSHIESREIMVVENHEISESRGEATEVVISGRSFETIMEQRIVGMNQVFAGTPPPLQYTLAAAYTWNQAVALMRDHILAAYTIDDNNALGNILVEESVGGTGEFVARTIPRKDLYSQVIELLAIDNLGIRSFRPVPSVSASTKCSLMVHRGVDRSTLIMFAHTTGEIDTADYLWSNKSIKNAVMMTGKWFDMAVAGPETGVDRRWMFLDTSDIDNGFASAPVGADHTNVVNAMVARANQALASQNATALIKAEATEDAKRYIFRQDFDLGDIVTVQGQYSDTAKMRIIEYVETEDETGEHSQPTFAAL